MVFEVKAHMIVKESETWGVMERLFAPFAKGVEWLASAVQKHPFIAVLILAILVGLVVWRNK